jgi:hypothetical protein
MLSIQDMGRVQSSRRVRGKRAIEPGYITFLRPELSEFIVLQNIL